MYQQLGCLMSEPSIQVVQSSLAKRSVVTAVVATPVGPSRRDVTGSAAMRQNPGFHVSIILDSAGLSQNLSECDDKKRHVASSPKPVAGLTFRAARDLPGPVGPFVGSAAHFIACGHLVRQLHCVNEIFATLGAPQI